MRKTAAQQVCTAVSSEARLVQAGVPAHWSNGQACSIRAACPARLGNPSASISPGLQKKALETFVLWVSGENQTFPQSGEKEGAGTLSPAPCRGSLGSSWRRISSSSPWHEPEAAAFHGEKDRQDRHLDTHSLPHTNQISGC